jgi:hypothetical protein
LSFQLELQSFFPVVASVFVCFSCFDDHDKGLPAIGDLLLDEELESSRVFVTDAIFYFDDTFVSIEESVVF